MYSISETDFKTILRTFSGIFLTKHPVNKNLISLNPEIIGSYMRVFTVSHLLAIWDKGSPSERE